MTIEELNKNDRIFMASLVSDLKDASADGNVSLETAVTALKDVIDYLCPDMISELPMEPGAYWCTDGGFKPVVLQITAEYFKTRCFPQFGYFQRIYPPQVKLNHKKS